METLADRARDALTAGEEEEALDAVRAGATQFADARLWQWTGLLYRALDKHGDAVAAFETAAQLAPEDAGISHGLARVRHEAGLDARAAYARARVLAPNDGNVLIGEMAAQAAAGEGEQAAAALAAILAQNPFWIEGHGQLAQLQALLGRPQLASQSIEQALGRNPAAVGLWHALFDLCIRRERYSELGEQVRNAEKLGLPVGETVRFAAIAASETGNTEGADDLFRHVPIQDAPIWRIRHLLRSGRAREALPLIDAELASIRSADAWPYALIAWRLVEDPRADWLAGNPHLVQVTDLSEGLPPLDRLAEVLRSLHQAKDGFLDQSVRGGTQTDGPLFSRIEPEIRAARSAVMTAIDHYRASLPPVEVGHPLLGQRRDRPIRFAGSWSVRLRVGGRHANHVHPQGWISSALYVSLPAGLRDRSGWLSLGQPPADLGVDLLPTHMIEPKRGRLVLFPSWMWHGTVPVKTGERLTIAFDVAPPR